MKTLDTSNLTPLVDLVADDKMRESARNQISRVRSMASDPEAFDRAVENTIQRWCKTWAFFEWLKLNFPIGGVFDYMGVPVMVARIERTDAKFPSSDVRWKLVCHCRGMDDGLMELRFTAPELQAIFGA